MTDAKILAHLAELLLEQQHETFIFPEATNETVTFTAHADANTWSAWAEIVDNNAVTLSSKFAAEDGHISVLFAESASIQNEIYMLEITAGPKYRDVARQRLLDGTTPNLPPRQEARIKSKTIRAGETVYYRMMCSAAGNKTITLHVRYHLHG